MKKIKKAIAALLSTTCLMSNMASMSTTAAYRPNDAVNYAYTYCGCWRWFGSRQYFYGYNSNYFVHNSDCTNFVSQCMYAGGVKMEGQNTFETRVVNFFKNGCVSYSSDDWFYIDRSSNNSKDAYSSTWTRVAKDKYDPNPGLKEYVTTIDSLFSRPGFNVTSAISHNGKNVYNNVIVGDIIMFSNDNGKSFYHSAIVTKKDNKDFYYTAHTNDVVDKAGSLAACPDKAIIIIRPRD